MQIKSNNKYLSGIGLLLSLAFLIRPDYTVAADTQFNEIEAVAESFHHALSIKDRESALATLSGDVMIMESGHVQTRDEYILHHLHADIDFTSSISSKRKVIRTIVEGNTGWIVSSTIATGKYKGRDISSTGAELMVLRQQNGTWKIVAIHWSSYSN